MESQQTPRRIGSWLAQIIPPKAQGVPTGC
jgi:hypothetical protein